MIAGIKVQHGYRRPGLHANRATAMQQRWAHGAELRRCGSRAGDGVAAPWGWRCSASLGRCRLLMEETRGRGGADPGGGEVEQGVAAMGAPRREVAGRGRRRWKRSKGRAKQRSRWRTREVGRGAMGRRRRGGGEAAGATMVEDEGDDDEWLAEEAGKEPREGGDGSRGWGSGVRRGSSSPWLAAASRVRAREMGSGEEVGVRRWVRAMQRWREDEGDGDRAEGRLGLGSGVAGPWA